MNIKFIKSNKFKSNSISLNIPIDIDEKITDLNLVSEMIKIGSKKYDSLKKLYSKLQEMYGTHFNCYVNKCGEVAVFTIYIEFLKDEYIDQNTSLWDEIINFLHEIFYNVLEEKGCFKEEFLKIEKENLRTNILSLVDSKNYYAYVKCEQISTKNEPYVNYIYGNVDRLEKINGKNLYEFYLNLRELPYYFVIIGNFDEDRIKNMLYDKFGKSLERKFNTDNNKFLKTDFTESYERFDITQTKLVINFKTPITIFNGDYYAFFVFNKILGSGYSKLYREVRQKRSLVYYINSYYEKFKGMLSIECGIDDKNFDVTKEIILSEIQNISNGEISESEIENAKRSIRRLLMSVQDKVSSMHSFIAPLYIFNKEFDINEFLKNIYSVDKNRIIDASKQIIKSAIFSVRPLEEE
ncbi:EF-P 5-aminopentanol modification-associated protein YfmF [Candidatus Arthromitus sp. SFB-turkey]|uniref:EF-P 5-aminopentanol modification-associated protein YfmF n=1 Tax=Candidatus Arthromitus sp. SFB-turkey TaxID=1840217 RepID=UPI0007F4D391|nr:insulinase family protein [Candidatus Arthromitus sp. SFB-turkey]OAT88303.1 peptidase [Candidatus Arthromitus sp. SFB-turkey]HJD00147.1 insulinase family protein [Candidatus Dwaynia gallinarum]